MAITKWKSNNGIFNNAASWTNGVPASGATAIFDGTLSQVSATQSLDMSAGTSFQLVVTSGYSGNIGSSGNPLIYKMASLHHHIGGTGTCYLQNTTSGSANGAQIVVDSSNRVMALDFNGEGDATSSWIGHLHIKAGHVAIRSKADFGSPDSSHLTVDGRLASCEIFAIDSGEDPAAHINVFGGTLINWRDLAASDVIEVSNGGKLIQYGAMDAAAQVTIGAGGTVEYIYTGDTTLPYMYIDGTLDLSQVTGAVTTNVYIISPNGFVYAPAGVTIGSTIEGVTNAFDLRDVFP